VASDANFKDIYASFNYRFNLEHDKSSREQSRRQALLVRAITLT